MASKISEDEMIEAIVIHKELVTLFELRRILNEGKVYTTAVQLVSDNFDRLCGAWWLRSGVHY